MSRRTKIIIFVSAIVLAVAGMFLWLRHSSPSDNPRSTNHTASETSPALPQEEHSPKAAPQTSEQQQIEGSKFRDLGKLSAAPIEFYGKVIDQDNNPLPGVEVVGRTGSKTGFMQEETRSYSTKTDANGLFTFSGFKGDGLVIELKKTGYNFGSERRQFLYSAIDPSKIRFTPERDAPVVFQMWKSLGAEPLIHYHRSLGRIRSDGTPLQIDLATGKLVKDGGDLEVSVQWGPRTDANSYVFDWSASVSAPNGGIVEGSSSIMFVAPAEGYKEKIDYRFAAGERQAELHRTFYVTSRGGQMFSRVELWMENQAADSATRVTVRAWINPSGSRNLEFDPAKEIKVK